MAAVRRLVVVLALLVPAHLVILGPPDASAGQITLAWNSNGEADLAGYKIRVGTAPGSYQTTIDVGNTTTHTITGLIDGTRYYFAVLAYDTGAAESGLSAEVNGVVPGGDTTAPVLSNITTSAITTTGATITWNTSEASDSQVDYGPTVSYGSTTPLAPAAVTAHQVVISGLDDGTTYHYRVRSRDGAGNLATSGDFSFTTVAGTPPSLSLTAPAGGATVAGSIVISATASDSDGIAGVQFRVDGAPVGAEDSVAPYSITWDSSTVANGAHVVTAVARDATGDTATSAPVNVTVSNTVLRLSPQDTSLKLDTTSQSTLPLLLTYTWPDQQVANATVMKFDLSALPAGAIVEDAVLHLWLLEADAAAAPYTITAHKLIGRNPVIAAATGYTADGAQAWTANSCCYGSVPMAQADIAAAAASLAVDRTSGDKAWTITSLVQGWAAEPATNFGLVLNADTTAVRDRYRNFASMEHADAAWRPYMHVRYSLPPSDTTAPVISAVAASSITATGATITWTTNEASDTQVEYGTTTAYGTSSSLNTTAVTAHSVKLTGLTGATTYNYRVRSRDAAGNLRLSGNFTFITRDGTAPTVSVTAPAASAVVSGTVTVTATASDNVGVTSVQFRLNSTNLGAADTTAPYSISWNTTTIANGTHTLRAIARDAAGNSRTSASVTVTVNNDTTAPALSAVGATAVTASGASIGWTSSEASDSQVEYGATTAYGSTTPLDTMLVTAHQVALSGLTAATTYHYRVRSRDAAGNLATSADFTFVTSDGTPPSVTVTAPASGAVVTGTVSLEATASDNGGVAGVQFRVDGVAVGGEDLTAPYAMAWDSASVADGVHAISAVARDAAGNSAASADVTVTVANGILWLSPQDTSLTLDPASYAAAPRLLAYTWPAGQVANAILMKFDLSSLPAGAAVHSATLRLALVESDATADSSYSLSAHRIVGPDPAIAAATGRTADGSTPWTAIACCYDNVPLAQADLSAPYDARAVDKGAGVKMWNLTAMVQEWLAAPTTNRGVLLNPEPVAADRYRYFASMEHADAALRPHLEIVYSTAGPSDTTPPAAAITAPTGGIVAGSVTVSADASDNVGIAGVQFTLDGAPLGPEDTTAPYQTSWNTAAIADGVHTLTAVARDAAGNTTTSAPVGVTVRNNEALLAPADTSLRLDAVNYSSGELLLTYTWPDFQVANATLMTFDLSSLPAGAIIDEATLHLALVDSDAAADALYQVSVHKLAGPGVNAALATGYTADGTTAWSATACCYGGVPMAQADAAPAEDTRGIDKAPGYKTWTITQMVRDWAADPAANRGLLVNADVTSLRDRYRNFASSEHPDASLRPYVRIRYRMAP